MLVAKLIKSEPQGMGSLVARYLWSVAAGSKSTKPARAQ